MLIEGAGRPAGSTSAATWCDSCDSCDGLDVGRGGEGGEAEGEEGGRHWDHSEGKKGEDNKLILDQANCKSAEMGSNLFWPDQYLEKIFFGYENTHSLQRLFAYML